MLVNLHFVLLKNLVVERFFTSQTTNGLIFSTELQYNLLLERDLSFAQQSFTYRDFNIILFALSIAIVSNDAR